MNNMLDICGTPIPLDKVKSYRIIQREYIYRPAYKEKVTSIFSIMSNQKYEFYRMVPFAAILNDDEYKLAVKKAKANTIKDSVAKDIAIGLVSTVANKFNIKELKSKKYKCENIANRTFEIFLEDVPAVVFRNDGRVFDVYKNDEMYPLLGEPIASTIIMVSALQIFADQNYLFYGNGIQLEDLTPVYTTLKNTVNVDTAIETKKKLIGLPFSKK